MRVLFDRAMALFGAYEGPEQDEMLHEAADLLRAAARAALAACPALMPLPWASTGSSLATAE